MRYHVLYIKTSFEEEWQQDVFDQEMVEYGIDTIVAEGGPINGYKVKYYLPTEQWELHQREIEDFVDRKGARLVRVEACPDRNWNAKWEQEHPVHELALGITIVPHCAFGAGYHQTTSMMIDALQQADLKGKTVLDHGTGTGVLAIFAKRLGAAQVVAVDIDEKSVENAKENAELNKEEIEVLHTSSFHFQPSTFNLILANIHRNILMEHMRAYAQSLQPGGELWMSGFFEFDCKMLQIAAQNEGLQVMDVLENGEWRLMKCRKEVHS